MAETTKVFRLIIRVKLFGNALCLVRNGVAVVLNLELSVCALEDYNFTTTTFWWLLSGTIIRRSRWRGRDIAVAILLTTRTIVSIIILVLDLLVAVEASFDVVLNAIGSYNVQRGLHNIQVVV